MVKLIVVWKLSKLNMFVVIKLKLGKESIWFRAHRYLRCEIPKECKHCRRRCGSVPQSIKGSCLGDASFELTPKGAGKSASDVSCPFSRCGSTTKAFSTTRPPATLTCRHPANQAATAAKRRSWSKRSVRLQRCFPTQSEQLKQPCSCGNSVDKCRSALEATRREQTLPPAPQENLDLRYLFHKLATEAYHH